MKTKMILATRIPDAACDPPVPNSFPFSLPVNKTEDADLVFTYFPGPELQQTVHMKSPSECGAAGERGIVNALVGPVKKYL